MPSRSNPNPTERKRDGVELASTTERQRHILSSSASAKNKPIYPQQYNAEQQQQLTSHHCNRSSLHCSGCSSVCVEQAPSKTKAFNSNIQMQVWQSLFGSRRTSPRPPGLLLRPLPELFKMGEEAVVEIGKQYYHQQSTFGRSRRPRRFSNMSSLSSQCTDPTRSRTPTI